MGGIRASCVIGAGIASCCLWMSFPADGAEQSEQQPVSRIVLLYPKDPVQSADVIVAAYVVDMDDDAPQPALGNEAILWTPLMRLRLDVLGTLKGPVQDGEIIADGYFHSYLRGWTEEPRATYLWFLKSREGGFSVLGQDLLVTETNGDLVMPILSSDPACGRRAWLPPDYQKYQREIRFSCAGSVHACSNAVDEDGVAEEFDPDLMVRRGDVLYARWGLDVPYLRGVLRAKSFSLDLPPDCPPED